ncbi:class I SAM-dependent methyltransferase [Mycolicibacterium sp. P9-22]|uniref:class I SAM-dependent methyltransferase n=1 Tax=Mycolicibacterium sp. P9-22 TaxID=2024613 RepID=UPI0011EED5A9|nr:class I SAM-dependent methyltransferase [Mycolicibacterium sp. P9-22]KAA0110457.1 class I SAM-dependent methyltransferase [Mycolicibacterium sp. P9-22]
MTADDHVRVDLTGAPQTMLATLYAKALDADLPRPILNDRWAKEAVAGIDYDWAQTTMTAGRSPAVTTRSAHFDRWVRQFLAVHRRATVLHLGCGLDSRYFRVAPGPDVQWYDIDYPEVAELRGRLLPAGGDGYHVVAASVTDPAWLRDIPVGSPVLAIGEGLTMYLTGADGIDLLNRIVSHCGTGELQFDAFNSLGIRSQWSNSVVRRSGATLHWAINGPDDIVSAVPGTRLLAWVSPFDTEAFDLVRPAYRVLANVMSRVPALRYMAQYHRYSF